MTTLQSASETGAPRGIELVRVRRSWRLQRRVYTGPARETVAILVGIVFAIVFCGILIAASGSPVWASYQALVDGAFGSRGATYETLVAATPLIFTGLAAAFAFRARIWNIGGEGQFFAGAMGAFFVGDLLGDSAPRALVLVLIFAGAALAGAIWAGIAGLLKARYNVNEIITTVMMNFIVLFLLSYLLSDLWRAEGTFYFQTDRMAESTWLPRFFDSRLHLGLVIAVATVGLVSWILRRTSFGYELRGMGISQRVARYAGVDTARSILLIMAISGAIAGFAGASELTGIHHRLQLDISSQVGFTGIIIALVARMSPAGVIFVAVGAGALVNGATNMQVSTGVPAALVDVLLGVTLMAVLVAEIAARYDLRRTEAL